MYTLDEQGNRLYTLKVCFVALYAHTVSLTSITQKVTDSGKITKSAHPGRSLITVLAEQPSLIAG